MKKFWAGIVAWFKKLVSDPHAAVEVAMAEAKPVPPPVKIDPSCRSTAPDNARLLLEKLAARTPKVTPIRQHSEAHAAARRRKQAEHQQAKRDKAHGDRPA